MAFDAHSSSVTVAGQVDDQATREKILRCCGNLASVSPVNDRMTVSTPRPGKICPGQTLRIPAL